MQQQESKKITVAEMNKKEASKPLPAPTAAMYGDDEDSDSVEDNVAANASSKDNEEEKSNNDDDEEEESSNSDSDLDPLTVKPANNGETKTD